MDPRFCLISALIFLPLLSNSPILILAQINTPCSPTMLSSVTGCMNFLTGGGSSPTTDCCEALKSLTGTGLDCLCLIVTASVPINLPINRTLAISLPRACGMPGVPVKCKASAAPLPAPGPVSLGPTTPPTETETPQGSPSLGPTTSPTSSKTPDDQNIPVSGKGEDVPTASTPSASSPSSSHPLKLPLLLLTFFAFEIINFF
ncbi:non-specific lipid transfer protein GPI-anchored 21-like [Raphanus sativus]|uniref:Non-specific lipid transfer protein GPI-anchored 21-like n=1 Tax=Raphanus sativus TaxID=3726 RepID=A0A9W3D1R0_RAPSA|nr:non-specific lipid transfer protein GPI-anchored 21-like [Raphanus sativus]